MVCVGGGATREDRKWHFERKTGGGNRTAHDEEGGGGGRGPIKSGVVKSEKEGLMLFSLMYI